MGGFNSLNLIMNTMLINAMNYAQSNSLSNNPQNINNTQNPQNSTLNQSSFTPMNYSDNSFNNPEILEKLSSAEQNVISTVEIEQRANYIKELLNLPKDFETLINSIQGNTGDDINTLKDLVKLLQNGKINLSALNSLIGENQKAAVQKLMMTIMTVSKMGSENVRQLKELMNLLQTSTVQDSSQLVKNIIMLYLPWLPLSVRSDMNLGFEIGIYEKNGENGENGKEEKIKILIQTANYGNVTVELELNNNNDVDIFMSASESFPEKEVLLRLKKENHIKTNVTLETNKDPLEIFKKERELQIISSDFVSPKLLQIAHSVIKIIIELDFSNFIINEDEE